MTGDAENCWLDIVRIILNSWAASVLPSAVRGTTKSLTSWKYLSNRQQKQGPGKMYLFIRNVENPTIRYPVE